MSKNHSLSIGFGCTLLVLGVSACSTARKVLIRPQQGGVVAIANADAPRGKAESIMNEICKGKGVKIIEERETPIASVLEKDVGQFGGTSSSLNSASYEAGAKHSRSELSHQNEWRITFECQ